MKVWVRAVQLAAIIGLTVGLAPKSWAGDVTFSGVHCKADGIILGYGPFGVHTNHTRALPTISCGAFLPAGAIVNSVELVVYDRSTIFDVSCTVMLTDGNGNATWSETQRTSGSGAAFQKRTFNPMMSTQSLFVTCTVPPFDTPGFSHFTSYRIVTQ